MKTRKEHIEWCKKRAIEEMDFHKNPAQGIISMMSDLRKHSETNDNTLITLCTIQLMTNPRMSRREALDFINGFN